MVKTEQRIQSDPSKKMLSTSTNSPPPPPTSSLKKMKKYKGVRMRSWGSWVSEIRAPNQKTRIWLGSYSTPEAAARAYDAALLCLKGPSANFNFPITTSSSHYMIPSDTIMSPKSIQRLAAAAAANSFTDNSNNNAISTAPAVSSPPPYSSSSSSISSSPSISDQVDDDVSLIQSIGSTPSYCYNTEPMSMTDSWFNFDDDQMFNNGAGASLFNPTTPMVDDYYFEGDFRLWSFAD
ncbi:ethylene-responsive transcription factor ERF014-like [Tripterygium wilfordii]|uniref:ethylene-responsive transcription factor ERF014-like n=1 Tax=Tripterygium wilfordii TaxID=458696 RepID=UPI0018F82B29|nr:ethylene-responsive transcription factor ERF014-like [Tripterygium wilfordii]